MVTLTEFVRPYGSKRDFHVQLEPDVEAKAKQITAKGFLFEIEVLRGGLASATIADPELDEDVAISCFVCSTNTEKVKQAISDMIKGFTL